MSHLFKTGDFISHSGVRLAWKIDCDALTRADWWTLALLVTRNLEPFSEVEGVSTGGLLWAGLLQRLTSPKGGLLIVDDVWTTGASMRTQRAGREARGVVLFARSEVDSWVTPLFSCDKALV